MRAYAKGTDVPVERSKAELDALLSKHGAAQRGIGCDDNLGLAIVNFRLFQRSIRIELPLPRLDEFKSVRRSTGRTFAETQHRAWEQACRERWRLLVLTVRAKLELVAIGGSTHEREFLADIYLPDGRTVGQAMAPQLRVVYQNGGIPPLLLGMGERE